jgi:excisionase family DNA binding protein
LSARAPEGDRLLTPAEVAAVFRVNPKTVSRWAKTGRIAAVRTPGGHRRYRQADVVALLSVTADGGVTVPSEALSAAADTATFEVDRMGARVIEFETP